MLISIIVPLYNEDGNIVPLFHKVRESLTGCDFAYEVIFVDDGSTDTSMQKLEEIARLDQRFKIIALRRNYGQTAALMAGFDYASGEIIVPMDGDLQNDPADIPRLIEKISEGYDVCSGWRQRRKDKTFTRVLPSRMANWLISAVSGVKLHDFGCTLKAYKKEITNEIKLYGEMHRFIPIYAKWQGAKIAELPVAHYEREQGSSKYGLERTIKVLLDLLFLISFKVIINKPIYIFGGFGLASICSSFFVFAVMLYYKIFSEKDFIQTPLPMLATMFFLIGVISILLGFLAEILMRTYHESQNKKIYALKKIYNLDIRSS